MAAGAILLVGARHDHRHGHEALEHDRPTSTTGTTSAITPWQWTSRTRTLTPTRRRCTTPGTTTGHCIHNTDGSYTLQP